MMDERQQRLLSLYEEGWSDQEIAEALGVTHQAVSARRRKAGLPPQKRVKSETLNATVARMVKAGRTDQQIAEATGLGASAVGHRRASLGLAHVPGKRPPSWNAGLRKPSPHGTMTRYEQGCRCTECRTANSTKWIRAKIARSADAPPEPIEHGLSCATNWGCHCPICKAAVAEMNERLKVKNDESRAQATRHGYQWTGPELELVAREDLSAPEGARMLGRTHYAVRRQRHLMRTGDPKTSHVAGVPKRKP